VQITLVMQPKGEVISLKAWRHRFWRDRLLLVWEKRDAFWSDLWRRNDDIISMVYLLLIAEAVLRIGALLLYLCLSSIEFFVLEL